MPTRDENRRMWGETWDWSKLGEEWTPEWAPWKAVILKYTLERWLERNKRILEIGPGGGRWTEELLRYDPKSVALVDLVPNTLELCKARFGNDPRIQTFVNDGRSLDFLGDASVDFVWSFDCFVHVDRNDIDAYFGGFARVMAPGALGIVHYPSIDRATGANPREGWRSECTSADMIQIVEKHGFDIVEDLFDPSMLHGNSSVGVFRKPKKSQT
jgi:SAM-dependent methyltransferase